jgi:glycosyltransferase involved in cell wall biosynthesis
MDRINVLWMIDHVCYDGSLHGGGRLYWNLLPQFDSERFRIIPCMLRASKTIREVFTQSSVPVNILDKAKFDPTTLWAFLQLIQSENIHVMHLHCYASSTFGRLASLIAGVPAIIHDYDTEVYFPYPAYLGIADRALAPVTQGAIAASPMVKQFLMQKRKIDEQKIRMMFHAIPREKFIPVSPDRINSAKQSLGVDETTKIIGIVTKLGPQRGNECLLKAARDVIQVFPKTVFAIVYKLTRLHRLPNRQYVKVSHAEIESAIAQLTNLAKTLGIEDHVRLVEWPEAVDELVAACDFIVAPFLSERFSSVHLLEAMAIGKLVIATDVGEQREIIQDGQNGFLIAPGDTDELAGKMIAVLNSPQMLEQLSAQAKVRANQYSSTAYVETLQDWYAELALNLKVGV